MTNHLLDKTLIPWLGSCGALWSSIRTAVQIFSLLVPNEVHYIEKNCGMFSSKTFSFRLKKDINILDDMGGESKLLEQKNILEVN